MRTLLCLSLVLAVCYLARAGDEPRPIEDIAYDISVKDMGEKGWDKFVKETRKSSEQHVIDGGSMASYLNDRLLPLVFGVKKGEDGCFKKLVHWLALYKHFDEPLPSYIAKNVTIEQRSLMDKMRDNFNWEKASLLFYKNENKAVIADEPKKDEELAQGKIAK